MTKYPQDYLYFKASKGTGCNIPGKVTTNTFLTVAGCTSAPTPR